MSTVFIICGNTASGKSTYSMELAKRQNAIIFSIDPWMQTLYGIDYNPQIHSFDWIIERTERCKTQIRNIAEPLIKQGINIILDFGFGDISSREFYRNWVDNCGADVSVHFLDVSVEERRKRVCKRNEERGETFSFEVTNEMFDYLESMFIPPTDDELINGLHIK